MRIATSRFACTAAGEGEEAAAEEALGQQAARYKHPVAEHAVTPLDTISGADARLVLDAPFYYHWPSGDSAVNKRVYSHIKQRAPGSCSLLQSV